MILHHERLRGLGTLPLLLAVLWLTGCATVGPDYVEPEIAAPPAWHSPMTGGLQGPAQQAGELAEWWKVFQDPELSGLIDRAVKGNPDLKSAQSKVRESRARRGISSAERFPTLSASGSARKSGDSDSPRENELYSAGFDAAWELDLFGRAQRSLEAAEANLQASRENFHDVLVSLAAETALNYLELRSYQNKLAVTEKNLKAQEETYQLVQWRNQAGLSDDLTVQQARYSLESTRASLPGLRSGLEAAMNRLAVLLGEQPGRLHEELSEAGPIPAAPVLVAVGVPAEALRQRPDVRKAERQLAAQTAQVGAATADLYPRFSLGGSIGLEALTFDSLLSAATRTWSYGLSFSWPIFKAGAIRQNIKVQSELQEQALIAYESTVLDALEEVENALTAYAQEQLRRESLQSAAEAAGQALALARNKYDAGISDFSSVLDAQRSLFSFESQLADSEGAVSSNLVRLYKALGGGWTTLAAETPLENQGN